MKPLNLNADPQQREAITFAEGAMLVLAGPGSGKTHVITQRIRYLIEEKNVDPSHILTITFTKAAALEMQKRCHQICPASAGAVFGTFHSVFYRMLRTSKTYHNFSVIKESEKKEIIQKVLSCFGNSYEQTRAESEIYLQRISKYKNAWPAQEKEEEDFLRILKQYNRACHDQEKMDFDDITELCHKMMEEQPKEKKKWQERFPYILVDEFQDVNGRQYELTKVLAQKYGNLFVVGDDDQSIYSFRGSDPSYMQLFLRDFPDCRQVVLEKNYRSGTEIVKAASRCVSHNKNRFAKKTEAVQQFENVVQIQSFETSEEEYRHITESVKTIPANETTAVLLRTNSMAEYAAEYFFKNKISYVIKEKRRFFYDITQVQDIMAVLRFVFCGQKRSDFLRFMNKPYRGILREDIKEETVNLEALIQKYRDHAEIRDSLVKLQKQCSLLSKTDPYSGIFFILNGMGYKQFMLKKACGNEEQKRNLLFVAEELLQRAKEFQMVEKFLSFVREYREEFENIQKTNAEPSEGQIRIMTYHASKGLEFDHVFLPQVNRGLVPHGNMLTGKQMEEERRMFYVAMTRAKKGLYITCVKNENGAEESLFVKELKEESIGT